MLAQDDHPDLEISNSALQVVDDTLEDFARRIVPSQALGEGEIGLDKTAAWVAAVLSSCPNYAKVQTMQASPSQNAHLNTDLELTLR